MLDKQLVIKKLKRLYVPVIFWGIISVILMPQFWPFKKILFGEGHLWFLVTLFWMFIMFGFFTPLIQKQKLTVDIAILGALVLLLNCRDFAKYLFPDLYYSVEMFLYLPFFFYLGLIYKRYIEHSIHIKISLVTLATILVLVVLFFRSFGKFQPVIVGFTLMMCLYAMEHIFNEGRKYALPTFVDRAFAVLDRDSMGIYIIHHILIWTALTSPMVIQFLESNIKSGPYLIFVLSFSFSLLLTEIIRRIPILSKTLG